MQRLLLSFFGSVHKLITSSQDTNQWEIYMRLWREHAEHRSPSLSRIAMAPLDTAADGALRSMCRVVAQLLHPEQKEVEEPDLNDKLHLQVCQRILQNDPKPSAETSELNGKVNSELHLSSLRTEPVTAAGLVTIFFPHRQSGHFVMPAMCSPELSLILIAALSLGQHIFAGARTRDKAEGSWGSFRLGQRRGALWVILKRSSSICYNVNASIALPCASAIFAHRGSLPCAIGPIGDTSWY